MDKVTHGCDIIIPTYNNIEYLGPCINSILSHTMTRQILRIIIVNNGDKNIEDSITKHPFVTILHTGKNLGWEGGLKFGLEHSKTPIVCFMNDDTYIPYSSFLWANKCLSEFQNPNVAAVGPTSNVVRGMQNIFLDQFAGHHSPYAPFLIGFCVFIRRSDLDAVGGIDETLPGGDDFDLSIRLRKIGKKLVIRRDTFVFHHGFKTGERLRGGPNIVGGWNSQDMTEKTNMGLIRKHGFREWVNCNYGSLEKCHNQPNEHFRNEKDIVKDFIKPGVVYDLGCGADKTIPEAIGIDRVFTGDDIPTLEGAISQADINADVTEELPVPDESADTIIVRHILEHCVDIVETLQNWIKKLKPDGRLIISVPEERIFSSIPMNPEHVHAFYPTSLERILNLIGMKKVDYADGYNDVSFTMVFEKKEKVLSGVS